MDKRQHFIPIVLAILIPAGCTFAIDPSLASRLTRPDQELALVDTSLPSAYSRGLARTLSVASEPSRDLKPISGLKILLRAEVAPPVASDGTPLQASHIAISSNGKTAYVASMQRGEAKFGGLDVFDVSNPSYPKLLSNELFPGGDIAALALDEKTLYLAGSKDDSRGNAWVLSLPIQANGVVAAAYRERHLPGRGKHRGLA
ncbi:MAG: hypothetical protein WCQ50_22195 [Spirochaetota bacterium]